MIIKMPGFPKSRNSSLWVSFALIIIFFAKLSIGCKSSGETERTGKAPQTARDSLAEYEKTFNPSDYDPNVSVVKDLDKKRQGELETRNVGVVAVPETIPGFRVQILLTADIDEANQTRDAVMKLLPEDWVYVVYDSPYYKVRVGDFPERGEADQMVKRMTNSGYKNSWVVPDNVIKNPPPRIPDIPIETVKPAENRR